LDPTTLQKIDLYNSNYTFNGCEVLLKTPCSKFNLHAILFKFIELEKIMKLLDSHYDLPCNVELFHLSTFKEIEEGWEEAQKVS